jgi:hypothetical protein
MIARSLSVLIPIIIMIAQFYDIRVSGLFTTLSEKMVNDRVLDTKPRSGGRR